MAKAYTKKDYTVGLICALDVELAAAQASLDAEHPDLPSIFGDTNAYSLGHIGSHNVVIACLPAGRYGLTAASAVAVNLMRSFPYLRFGLMIGIGGAAHIDDEDVERQIRLGDVVVSNPQEEHGGVIQFDYGKLMSQNQFKQTGSLNNPPTVLSNAVQKLRAKARRKGYELVQHLDKMLQENPKMVKGYSRPLPETDKLYRASYIHPETTSHCRGCDLKELIEREPRDSQDPIVHYGLIGSSNHVLKDAVERDNLHAQKKIICFEMEAAGLVNDFPCIVIRGICDYADSHKNKSWQGYASAVAAAYARELLLSMTSDQVSQAPSALEPSSRALDTMHDLSNAVQVDEARILTLQVAPNKHAANYKCLRDLHVTNPRLDKERIEKSNGGLYQASCDWVLENDNFLLWKENNDNRLLQIKGSPGKGKTMLMCGLINALDNVFGAYFFFQETDVRINTASAALRGIIFMLADMEQKLIVHIRKRYDKAGKALFEDANSWVALCEIFYDILDDLQSRSIDMVIVVDAINECVHDRDKFMDMILQSSKKYTVKWIVSSRGGQDIDSVLSRCPGRVQLSLKYNGNAISKAVTKYINHRVDELDQLQRYDDETRDRIVDYLETNAESTFLWVSLVCKDLEKYGSCDRPIERLKRFPPSLNEIYHRMIDEMLQSENKDSIRTILAAATLMYRPVTLAELRTIAGMTCEEKVSLADLKNFVQECGGFLTIRESTIAFVHQSARNYILQYGKDHVFPNGTSFVHHEIFLRLIKKLTCTLKTDILGLGLEHNAAMFIGNVRLPNLSPLNGVEYACFYWPRHLIEATKQIEKDAVGLHTLLNFLKKHLLNWIEANSLFYGVPQLIARLYELDSHHMIQNGPPELQELIHDAHKFCLFFKQMIQKYPLQIYHSGLIFSPTNSLIKQIYEKEHPDWVKTRMHAEHYWSSELTRLWSHESTITAVAYSPDSNHLACGFEDGMLELWNTVSGVIQRRVNITNMVEFEPPSNLKILKRRRSWPIYYHDEQKPDPWRHTYENITRKATPLKEHEEFAKACKQPLAPLRVPDGQPSRLMPLGDVNRITEIAFCGDKDTVVFAVDGRCAGIWKTQTDQIERHPDLDAVTAPLIISCHGKYMVHGINNRCAVLYDSTPGAKQKILNHRHLDLISLLKFSPDGELLAACSRKGRVTIWASKTGDMVGSLDEVSLHEANENIHDLSIAPDGKTLIIASQIAKMEDTIRMVDIETKIVHWKIKSSCSIMYLSPDGARLVVVTKGNTKLYNANDGTLLKDLRNNKPSLCHFSRSSMQLATTEGGSLRLFTMHAADNLADAAISPAKLSAFRNSYFADGHRLIALESPGMLMEVYNTEGSRAHGSQQFPDCYISTMSTRDAKFACITEETEHITILDLKTLKHISALALPDYAGKVLRMKFSPGDTYLAVGTAKGCLLIWDLDSEDGEPCINTRIHSSAVKALHWAAKASRLAVQFGHDVLCVWDVDARRQLLRTQAQLTEGSHLCLTLSPDGTRLVTTHAKLFEIWNVDKASLAERMFRSPDYDSPRFESMALSYDNRLLACASKIGLELWDLSKHKLQQPFEMKLPSFENMSFTEDGSTLHLQSGVLDVRQTDSDSVPTLSLGSEKDIFCTNDFVFKNNKPLMWLPEAFRSARTEYRQNRLILHHESGRIALLEFMTPEERRIHEERISPLSRATTCTFWG